jgi:hypothetical protein
MNHLSVLATRVIATAIRTRVRHPLMTSCDIDWHTETEQLKWGHLSIGRTNRKMKNKTVLITGT